MTRSLKLQKPEHQDPAQLSERDLERRCVAAGLPQPVCQWPLVGGLEFDLLFGEQLGVVVRKEDHPDLAFRQLACMEGYFLLEVTQEELDSGEAFKLIERAVENAAC